MTDNYISLYRIKQASQYNQEQQQLDPGQLLAATVGGMGTAGGAMAGMRAQQLKNDIAVNDYLRQNPKAQAAYQAARKAAYNRPAKTPSKYSYIPKTLDKNLNKKVNRSAAKGLGLGALISVPVAAGINYAVSK